MPRPIPEEQDTYSSPYDQWLQHPAIGISRDCFCRSYDDTPPTQPYAEDPEYQSGRAYAGGGTAGWPMQPDCRPVRGKVPGPVNHLLCATHGHVLDVNARIIIANSLAEYKKRWPRKGA